MKHLALSCVLSLTTVFSVQAQQMPVYLDDTKPVEILEEKRVRHINSFIAEHPEALKITSGANNIIYKEKEGE